VDRGRNSGLVSLANKSVERGRRTLDLLREVATTAAWLSRNRRKILRANVLYSACSLRARWRSHVAPLLFLAGGGEICYGLWEYSYAGGHRGLPFNVVERERYGLPMPAHAEIVLEGEIVPGN
jgi:hypothetical protein